MGRPLFYPASFLALGLAACCPPRSTAPASNVVGSSAPQPASPRADHSPLYRDHPLVGRIYDVRGQRFITPSALVAALQGRPLLLGEKHDNVDHHRLEGWVIAQRFPNQTCSAAVFEMLDDDQGPALAVFMQEKHSGQDADALAATVQWQRSGWPAFELYAPVFEAVLDHCRAVRPGSFPRERSMDFARRGIEALPPTFPARASLQGELPQPQQAELREEMRASHCNMLPDSMLDGMVFIQRVRDARLAASIQAQDYPDVVLVAGNGHVRRDRGVPRYLRQLFGQAPLVVSFQEAVLEATHVEAHAEAIGQQPLPYDYVWFTASSDDSDPCAQLKSMKVPAHGDDDRGSLQQSTSPGTGTNKR